MLTPEQQEHFGIMKAEVIDLNILAHCYVRKSNRWIYLWHETTRHFIYEELTALRYMENGLILHLTKLDDDCKSSAFSFRGALKELNTGKIDTKKRDKLNDLLTAYRKDLGELKKKHRNIRIAHLNDHTEMQLDQFMNFNTQLLPLIKQANAIGDLIWGSKIEYGFDLGKYANEGILRFRELTEKLHVDFTSEKGW